MNSASSLDSGGEGGDASDMAWVQAVQNIVSHPGAPHCELGSLPERANSRRAEGKRRTSLGSPSQNQRGRVDVDSILVREVESVVCGRVQQKGGGLQDI